MRRTIFSYLSGFSFVFALAAAAETGCSVTTTDVSVPDSGTPGDDAGDPAAEDASTADTAVMKPTKVGAKCNGPGTCSTGQSCVSISSKGGEAICLANCSTAGHCTGTETCSNGFCIPTCDEGCPAAMQCISDINECMFDCEANPALCGPSEMCQMGIQCVKAVPDAGPLTCMPGGGAATSGITGSKTVGSLTVAEQGTFCDWAAAVSGGYNCSEACDGGITTHFATSQADCISKFTKPGCAATVTQVEACLKENAQDLCSLKILTAASCAPVRACP